MAISNPNNTAIITGVTGQDGAYLAQLLLEKGQTVIGLVRPSSRNDILNTIPDEVRLHRNFKYIFDDLLDECTIRRLFDVAGSCGYFYHLAALSHVGDSFKHPELTMRVNLLSTVQILEYIKNFSPHTRFYFAGTSETLADACSDECPANEKSPKSAHSPYAASKLAAQELVKQYRHAYGLYCVNGLAFNHESPRRGPNFVTSRIVDGLKEYKRSASPLRLGGDTFRDWHHAKDTVHGMYLALQAPVADDYVFASGEAASVSEFADLTCELLGVDFEKAIIWNKASQRRPWDVDFLKGDASKAEETLGWRRAYTFKGMVLDMIEGRE